MSQIFVLARNADKTRIELVLGAFSFEKLSVGDEFVRDPVTAGSRRWTIIKVFDSDEQRQLAAFTELAGHGSVAELFKTDL
jgi:hypothetical protein